MPLRPDWLDDTWAFSGRAAHHPANPLDAVPPDAPAAGASVLTIPANALDGTPFVETGDGFRSRDPESFVPMNPGVVHDSPIHIAPTPSDLGLSDEVAFISGVYADGTQPLDAYYAWNDDTPATYTGGFTNSRKWGAPTAGTAGGTIKYFFTGTSNWSPTEKSFFEAGLALWSDVTNISFSEASTAGQAQIVFTRGHNGSASTNPALFDPGGGGMTGGSVLLTMTKATISIDTSVSGFGPIENFTDYGGYPIETLLHEEGHAIGLGHAGPYNGTVDEATQQFSAYDTRLWSIMSYIEPRTASAAYFSQYPVTGTNWGIGVSGSHNDPTGLMPLDILAAQALYGAPSSTPLSGGQVFGFHSNVTGPSAVFFDFTQNTAPILTLWDAGTGNTLDLSGWSAPSTINLNPGTFSSADGMVNNLAVAFGTAIDLFVGGAGSDSVTGNNDGDTFTGGGGNDTFTGGSGTDTAVFSGNFADYTIASVGGGFEVTDNRAGSPDGSDTLSQVEQAKFADGTHTLGSVDNPAILRADAFATTEAAVFGAGHNVFADNGSGADSDPDGPALQVTAVNGSAAAVGHQIALASGALLTLNADGTLLYDPNHAFDTLPAPGSGASNTTAADSFTYSDGSVSATVTVTVSGVDSDDTLLGTPGNDTIDGGSGNDTFVFSGVVGAYAGGYDTATQTFTFDGPDGHDTVRNVENFRFADGTFRFDTGSQAWSAIGTVRDAQGSIASQSIAEDNGTRWLNEVDTDNAASWLWRTTSFGADGQMLSQTGTNDDGTHWLSLYSGGAPAGMLSFDASWNVTGGSVSPAAFDTLLWFTHPYDPDFGGPAENLTLSGGANVDVLSGFGGNDTLSGGGGNDYLSGGAGSDDLTGGTGADRFSFAFGDGIDTVEDFAAGGLAHDILELHNYGIANFAALQPFIAQTANGVTITFDAQNQIVLAHVQASDLNASDFLFG